MKTFFSQKRAINYLYFLLLFLSISTLSFLLFLPLHISPWFFTYSLAQGLFEIAIFAFLAHTLKPSFILLTAFFTLILAHYTTFTMLRLLDAPLSYLLKFFVGHGVHHVISVFQAINMNQNMMILIGIAILSIPAIGILLYKITNRYAQKKPFSISCLQILYTIASLGCFLLVFEWITIPQFTHAAHAKYQKTLPFGTTLLSPSLPRLILSHPISPPLPQNEALLHFKDISIAAKPNIYLFVIETFRKDFVNEQIAPHLTSFGEENIQFPFSFANANSTQYSWFAIFHSLFPYHLAKLCEEKSQGSIPLQLLKKLGYKVHVYSSADLRYFEMDTMIFGPERMLADQIVELSLNRTIEPWERDALVMQSFEKEILLKEGKEGNLFLFFFDATHSEYSFPKEFADKFTPIIKQIDYLTLNPCDIEPIKNRYRNSIAYVDSLIEKFIATLKQENLYENAIIAITGDHGEEFFEEGALFHGTHLNCVQTNVPIFFKFQNNELPIHTNTATHIDIFPSILHFLTGKPPTEFDGQSVFAENRWPYRLAILQNGAKTPSEFTIENENYKIRARFNDPDNLYTNRCLDILSLPPHPDDFLKVFEYLNKRLPEQIPSE